MKELVWNGNKTRAEYRLTQKARVNYLFAEVYQSTMADDNCGRYCVIFDADLGFPMRWFDSKDEAYLFTEATFALEVM
jgi:hypothetical protein